MKRRDALSTLFMASAATVAGIGSAFGASAPTQAQPPFSCEIPEHEPQAANAQNNAAASSVSPGTYTLPALGYAYDALEPAIDAQTMELHYSKHHASYVEKLNAALLQALPLVGKSKTFAWPQNPEELFTTSLLHPLKNQNPELYQTLINQGGGHINHSLFWKMLKKPKSASEARPKAELLRLIERSFGSFDKFQDEFSAAAKSRFGSGWTWLSLSPEKQLVISSTPNQESPITWYPSHTILLGLDVWEHAYYLKYQNRRDQYIQAFFGVIHWDYVSQRYAQALQRLPRNF